MKKFLLVLVTVAVLSPAFAEEKKDEHATSDKKVESTEKKGAERAEKDSADKSELSKKVDACLKDRPEKAAK
ncbi:MAG: hypothetical protein EBQ92_05550 [Proteobacteria bacterium]|nr:hypothetical protein [Pseudomonadota bacterium]